MKKVVIVGCKGRMGSLIAEALDGYFDVVGVARNDDIDLIQNANLVVDFATHESSVKSAEYCLKKKIPLIIGSTGQTEKENMRIEEISKEIKIIRKANFSSGMDILKRFIDIILPMQPNKLEIVEKHHINKRDKPSGTALELKNYIQKFYNGDVEIISIREGQEMGEHEIIAYVCDERLSMKHNVFSRNAFVCGVVKIIEELLQ